MLLTRKDGRIDKEERNMIMYIGKILGFEIAFCRNAIEDIMDNKHVIDSPPPFFLRNTCKVVYENPEEKKISGPLAQLFRNGDLSNIHPEDMMKVREGFDKIMSGEIRNLDIDFRFFVCGSTETAPEMRWVHCRASLIDYMGEEAILVNKLDVTKTKELEFLLRTEDKMASLGRVTSGIAHRYR